MASVEIAEVRNLEETLAELREQIATLSEDRWLDVGEAAEHMRCSKKHVYEITGAKKIPVHKDGSRNLYLRSELDSYLTNGHHAATNLNGR